MASEEEPTLLLSYYYDADAKTRLPQDAATGNYLVDFGTEARENPPIAGIDTVTTTVYVRNDHNYPMELKPLTLDKDLTITEYPDLLEPGEIGLVKFAFAPSANRIKPLEGGSWDFTMVVYSKV
jgi:hypothetical protein